MNGMDHSGLSGPNWTKVDRNGQKWKDHNGPNELKWTIGCNGSNEPKWVETDQNRPT